MAERKRGTIEFYTVCFPRITVNRSILKMNKKLHVQQNEKDEFSHKNQYNEEMGN